MENWFDSRASTWNAVGLWENCVWWIKWKLQIQCQFTLIWSPKLPPFSECNFHLVFCSGLALPQLKLNLKLNKYLTKQFPKERKDKIGVPLLMMMSSWKLNEKFFPCHFIYIFDCIKWLGVLLFHLTRDIPKLNDIIGIYIFRQFVTSFCY